MKKVLVVSAFLLIWFGTAPPGRADESFLYYRDALDEYLGMHYARATVDLQLAIRGNAQSWQIHQLLGYCYFKMKDEASALDECQKSLNLHGDNPRLRGFVEWLKLTSPRPEREISNQGVLEGPEEAQMPDPPDLIPAKAPAPAKPDPLLDVLKHFHFQLGPGLDFLGEGFANTSFRASGQGWEFGLGYALDDRWSFWLETSFYGLPGRDSPYISQEVYPATLYETSLSARYGFGGGFLRPYATAGIGLMYAADPGNGLFTEDTAGFWIYYGATSPVFQGRLGLECPLDPGLSLFLETGADLIFVNISPDSYISSANELHSTALDYPVNLGLILDPWSDEGKAASPAPPNAGFFTRLGGGLALEPDSYADTYPPPAIGTLCGAFGYDFPDGVSLFADAERFPAEWAVLGNLQVTLPTRTLVEPYLYGGMGVELPSVGNNPAGVALQVALGLQFQVDRTWALYAEARDYASYLYDPYLNNLLGNTLLEGGLKISFPDGPAPGESAPVKN